MSDQVYRGREEDQTGYYRDLLYLSGAQRAAMNEQLLMWEHELSQPEYYNYFLEEVTR